MIILESGNDCAINGFRDIIKIVNPDKFHIILFNKKNPDLY